MMATRQRLHPRAEAGTLQVYQGLEMLLLWQTA
jgi:hypothetical protein